MTFGELLSEPLRNGLSYASKFRGSGVAMINMREIFAYDRISNQPCELVPMTDRERATFLLGEGDLLFARQSLTYEGAGKCSLFLGAEEARTWESHIIRARLNEMRGVPGFYYYYFRSPQGRRSIETIIQQVAAAGIRGSDLARLPVPQPPVKRQQAIAEVLSALDDKIAANARLLTVADGLVRAEWDSTILESAVTVPLALVADAIRDLVDPSEASTGSIYIGLEHVPRRQMWLDSWGEAEVVTSTKSRFAKGDVLFGKLRPYFHKVVSAPSAGIGSTDIIVMRAHENALAGFVLAAASSDAVVQWASASSAGTRMPRTSWQDLATVEIPWPGDRAAREFSIRVVAIRDAVEARIRENQSLTATRDALLPALISGRLRVRDAEILLSI